MHLQPKDAPILGWLLVHNKGILKHYKYYQQGIERHNPWHPNCTLTDYVTTEWPVCWNKYNKFLTTRT